MACKTVKIWLNKTVKIRLVWLCQFIVFVAFELVLAVYLDACLWVFNLSSCTKLIKAARPHRRAADLLGVKLRYCEKILLERKRNLLCISIFSYI